eukprot:scaffold665_cov341-Prasinococcus_capsulatus_cf.AAC.10
MAEVLTIRVGVSLGMVTIEWAQLPSTQCSCLESYEECPVPYKVANAPTCRNKVKAFALLVEICSSSIGSHTQVLVEWSCCQQFTAHVNGEDRHTW